MNEHPTESLPAFVLGALDAAEAVFVAQHISHCQSCRADADEFRATVGMLPYGASLREPPARIKRQLLARVAVDLQERGLPSEPARPSPLARPAPPPIWARAATVLSLALAIMLAFVTVDARRRLDTADAQLSQAQQALTQARDEIARQGQQLASLSENTKAVTTFIAQPATVGQPLKAHSDGTDAKMYMQPGHNRVVLVISGLPELKAGEVYQFWFATDGQQVPSQTFAVSEGGLVEVVIDAPLPVDRYAQVMVTVEQGGGSTTPSPDVVLEAEL